MFFKIFWLTLPFFFVTLVVSYPHIGNASMVRQERTNKTNQNLQSELIVSNDSESIEILADNQKLDGLNNIIIWQGNVIVTRRNLKIYADQVILDAKAGEGNEVLTAKGQNTSFTFVLSSGKPVEAKAKTITYHVATEKLVLNGQAKVFQEQSTIKAERIEYDVLREAVKAVGDSDKQQRVSTIIKLDKKQ